MATLIHIAKNVMQKNKDYTTLKERKRCKRVSGFDVFRD